MGEMRLTQDSLRLLAEGTGGFAAVDTNSFTEAFERIVDANSRYYLLGYAPPAHPRDGRFHRIEVRVKRPGLTVTARRGYPSPSGKTTQERKQDALERWNRERRAGGANDTSVELRSALNSPVQQPGLTLSVQAVPLKGTAKEASVALAVELQGAELEFAPQPSGLMADTHRGLVLRFERRRPGAARHAIGAESRDSTRHVSAREGDRHQAQRPHATPARAVINYG